MPSTTLLGDSYDKLIEILDDQGFITCLDLFNTYGIDSIEQLKDTTLTYRYLYGDKHAYLQWLESYINKKKQEYDAYDIIQRLIYTKITFCDMEKEQDYIPFWKKIYFDLNTKYGDCYDELTELNNLYTEFNQ